MKNRSIRFKMTLWFSLVLILLVGLAFFVVRFASGMVLHSTIRDYLISTVEENTNKIEYTDRRTDRLGNIYIPYGDGFLEIDEDFLDVVNDVYSALYTSDGTMLYGENPLALQTGDMAFAATHTWHLTEGDVRYELYDRKLAVNLPDGKELWIRGIVPETRSAAQLGEITRISLVLLPILIALAILFSYLLVNRMLRPIRTIEQTATQISRGTDLKQRIDVGGKRDEVGNLAEAFNHMIERLDASFEAERRFTSDASHELRTPTSVILAQTEVALEKPRSAEEYERALRVVQRQGQRMSALIGDMLDVTRLDQNAGQNVEMEMVDLSEAVRECAEQMEPLRENEISLRTDITPGLCVRGNRLLLSRMAQNLISNAYRYGRVGGEILVRVYEENEDVILAVQDDGIGIAEEEQGKIFGRFYRSDASRTQEGTGLGLAMVRRIADLHGASIELESEAGQGSCFRILFKKIPVV